MRKLSKLSLSNYFSLLKGRDLRFLWLAQSASRAGDALRQIAILWFVLEATGSALAVGIVAMFYRLSIPLLCLISGYVTDWFNRKRVMIVADLASALLVLLIPILSSLDILRIYHLYVVVFLLAACLTFSVSARNAGLPNLVNSNQLHTANALFQLSDNGAAIFGYALGGFIVGVLGPINALFVTVFTFLASAVAIYLTKDVLGGGIKSDFSIRGIKESLLEGIECIKGERVLLAIVPIGLLLHFATPLGVLVPKLVYRIGAEALGFGLVLSFITIGGVIGSLISGGINAKAGSAYTYSIVAIGFIYLGISLSLTAPLETMRTFYFISILFALFLLMGAFISSINIYAATLEQRLIPDEIRGKTTGLLALVSNSANIPSPVLFGAISDISLLLAFSICGTMYLLAGGYSRLRIWKAR